VDSDGRPVTDADVQVVLDNERGFRTIYPAVDDRGIFQFSPSQGNNDIIVSASGFACFTRTYLSSEISTEGLIIRLDRSDAVIRIKVIDQDGKPQSGISMRIRGEESKGLAKSARTDDQGIVEFSGVNITSCYQVVFGSGKPGEFHWREDRKEVPSPAGFRRVRPSREILVFRLVPPASVGGIINIDRAYGKLLCLNLMNDVFSEPLRGFGISTTIGQNGEFLFSGLPPGRYHLWTSAVKGRDSYKTPLAVWHLGEGEKRRGLVYDEP